jgi:hypothetical protein
MADITTELVIQTLNQVINDFRPPALPIPPPLILAGGFQRKGLSAREMAKEVIVRQQEAGAPTDTGGVSERMERIRMETIIRWLLEEARITIVIPAGIPVTTTGVSAVGTVVSQGATVSFGVGTGIIQ